MAVKTEMKKIPFFSNTADGTHCYQAALKMVLTFLSPKGSWPFEKLDKLSQKLEGKWTWPTASLIWLLDHGYEVKLIETFSYAAFAKDGIQYLIKEFGEEVAKAQEANSYLQTEQKLASEFAKRCQTDQRIPTWEDLKKLFNQGYLIICNINACILSGKEGYSGHFVVPTEIQTEQITFHDPGLPPKPNIMIDRSTFEKAWGYPSDGAKNILAIRLDLSLDPSSG